jgi:hypothetical protein
MASTILSDDALAIQLLYIDINDDLRAVYGGLTAGSMKRTRPYIADL